MRTRSFTTDAMTTYGGYTWNLSPGTSASQVPYSGPCKIPSAFTKYMEDVVTDRFRAKIREGSIVMNPLFLCESDVTSTFSFDMEFFRASWDVDTSSYKLESRNQNRLTSGTLARDWDEYPLLASLPKESIVSRLSSDFNASSTTNKSRIVAAANAAAADNEALALVTFAELGKTMTMFASGVRTLGAITRYLHSLPREELTGLSRATMLGLRRLVSVPEGQHTLAYSVRHGLPRVTKRTASAWLGYRYGIMATYYDIMSWFEAGKTVGKRKKTRSFAKLDDKYVSDWQLIGSGGGLDHDWVRKARFVRNSTYSAGALLAPETSSQASAFGLGNLLSTAWELKFLSFVYDWFFDVSKRLQALETQMSRTILGSWVTEHHSLLRSWYHAMTPKHSYEGGFQQPGSLHCWATGIQSASTTQRSKVVIREVNPFVSPIPLSSVRLNWQRLADAAALLRVLGPKLHSFARL